MSRRLRIRHFDTDDYFWERTDPPYTVPRPLEARVALLRAEFDAFPSWVISGSLIDWGDVFIPKFTLVVFLFVPTEIRRVRLDTRERARHGSDVDLGGPLHERHQKFLSWAAGYDDGLFEGRSLERHRVWLSKLSAPWLEIVGTPTLEESVDKVLQALPTY